MTKENPGIPADEWVEKIGLLSWPEDLRITCSHGTRHTEFRIQKLDTQGNETGLKKVFVGEARPNSPELRANFRTLREAVLDFTDSVEGHAAKYLDFTVNAGGHRQGHYDDFWAINVKNTKTGEARLAPQAVTVLFSEGKDALKEELKRVRSITGISVTPKVAEKLNI